MEPLLIMCRFMEKKQLGLSLNEIIRFCLHSYYKEILKPLRISFILLNLKSPTPQPSAPHNQQHLSLYARAYRPHVVGLVLRYLWLIHQKLPEDRGVMPLANNLG